MEQPIQAYACPMCDSAVKILAASCQVIAHADGTAEADGGFDWLRDAPAACTRCEWIGVAQDASGRTDVCQKCQTNKATMHGPDGECQQSHKCENCSRRYLTSELKAIEDLADRVEPGGIVPSGQCPAKDCEALCYPYPSRWKEVTT